MPADNLQRAKQYGGPVAALQASQRISPYNPFRTFLIIQNTGANPLNVRFGEPNQSGGGDLTLAVGGVLQFTIPQTCPKEAVNLFSTLGTTVAVVEGTISAQGPTSVGVKWDG